MRSHFLLLIGLIAILLFGVSGCTIIGRKIGSSIDGLSRNKSYLEIGGLEFEDEREFYLRDAELAIRAKFLRLDTLDLESYQAVYKRIEIKLRGSMNLPQIGDTLLGTSAFIFRDFTYIYEESQKKPTEYGESRFIALNVISVKNSSIKSILLKEINSLKFTNGISFSREELMSLAIDGMLPLKSAVVLDVGGNNMSVDLNNIASFQGLETHKGRKIGTIVGSVLDIGYIIFCIVGAIAISRNGLGS